jgi:hypothetical protein
MARCQNLSEEELGRIRAILIDAMPTLERRKVFANFGAVKNVLMNSRDR